MSSGSNQTAENRSRFDTAQATRVYVPSLFRTSINLMYTSYHITALPERVRLYKS